MLTRSTDPDEVFSHELRILRSNQSITVLEEIVKSKALGTLEIEGFSGWLPPRQTAIE